MNYSSNDVSSCEKQSLKTQTETQCMICFSMNVDSNFEGEKVCPHCFSNKSFEV